MTLVRRLSLMLVLWLCLWGWGMHISLHHSLHPIEAEAIAIARPQARPQDTSLRARVSDALDNVRDTWSRAQDARLPAIAYPPLALGMMLLGDHEISLRLPLMLGAMLALALFVRVAERRLGARWMLTLTLMSALGAILFTAPPPYDWRNALCKATEARQPLDASLIALPTTHVSAYYLRQCGFVRGINIHLSDAITDETLADYRERLARVDAVWLLMPADHPAYESTVTSWQVQGWQVALDKSHDGIMIQRLSPP